MVIFKLRTDRIGTPKLPSKYTVLNREHCKQNIIENDNMNLTHLPAVMLCT